MRSGCVLLAVCFLLTGLASVGFPGTLGFVGSEMLVDGAVEALKGVSFDVAKGKTFGIVGRNGSGKSTMLKLIAGIGKPTSGTVRVDGRVSALIELGAGFHPEISGRENVYINGLMLGLSRREIAGRRRRQRRPWCRRWHRPTASRRLVRSPSSIMILSQHTSSCLLPLPYMHNRLIQSDASGNRHVWRCCTLLSCLRVRCRT
jgi:ABC-type dipeptide/oligopeptide/nickel transport system ATPase component